MTKKCEKPQGETSMEAWSTKKMEVERMEKIKWRPLTHADLICVVLSPFATQNYKTAIMSHRITKMPLWASNVDPLALLTWK